MLPGEQAYLFSALSQYGYSLLQPDQMADPNELLANLVSAENRLTDDSSRERFRRLVALSVYLFNVFGLENLRPPEFAREGPDDLLTELRNAVEQNQALALHPGNLDLDRVKKTFLNYYMRATEAQSSETKANLREEFRREFYLSLLFAPKQRDLLQKKLRGEPLTKTEREYFSRVVKKKLLALADPDLHRLAQKALQAP